MEKTKICKKCGKQLPASNEYFANKSSSKDGLAYRCKSCTKEYRDNNKELIARTNKEYAERNKEKIAEKRKVYNEINKERRKQYSKEYYYKNREKILEEEKKYREENKEYFTNYFKNYHASNKDKKRKYENENKERIAIRTKEYAEKNKEHIRKKRLENYKSNPEPYIRATQKRRSLKKSLPYTLTVDQWFNIKEKFDNKCCYCGKETELTQEHFIPLSNSGEYTHNNILPACKSCNSSKNNKDFFEWYPKQIYYSKKRERKLLCFLNYKNGVQQLKLSVGD